MHNRSSFNSASKTGRFTSLTYPHSLSLHFFSIWNFYKHLKWSNHTSLIILIQFFFHLCVCYITKPPPTSFPAICHSLSFCTQTMRIVLLARLRKIVAPIALFVVILQQHWIFVISNYCEGSAHQPSGNDFFVLLLWNYRRVDICVGLNVLGDSNCFLGPNRKALGPVDRDSQDDQVAIRVGQKKLLWNAQEKVKKNRFYSLTMTSLCFEIEIVVIKDSTPKWFHTFYCQVSPPKHKQHVPAGAPLNRANTITSIGNWHVLIAHWRLGFLNSTLVEAILFHSRDSQKRHFATCGQSSQPKISQWSKPKRNNFSICDQ